MLSHCFCCRMGGQRFVQVLWHECGHWIAQCRSQCAVTGICPIRFNACFEYIYTCSRLFMFMLSSHILCLLCRHRCYLSHAFLSHPVLTSLQLRVVFFLPAHLHSLIILMYIRLCRLDHIPFPGMRKSLSNQISVFAHPNKSNKFLFTVSILNYHVWLLLLLIFLWQLELILLLPLLLLLLLQ